MDWDWTARWIGSARTNGEGGGGAGGVCRSSLPLESERGVSSILPSAGQVSEIQIAGVNGSVVAPCFRLGTVSMLRASWTGAGRESMTPLTTTTNAIRMETVERTERMTKRSLTTYDKHGE